MGRNENTRRRLRKGVGGGADAGTGLGSLIGHEYHRMMTSEADTAFLSRKPDAGYFARVSRSAGQLC